MKVEKFKRVTARVQPTVLRSCSMHQVHEMRHLYYVYMVVYCLFSLFATNISYFSVHPCRVVFLKMIVYSFFQVLDTWKFYFLPI